MSTSPSSGGVVTKSAPAVARAALAVARKALPAYSNRFSPKKYTQHRHFAILAVRRFSGLDCRGVRQLLLDWPGLRRVLGLKAVPHWTAVEKAEKRLVKKGGSTISSTRPSARRASAAR
jgi:hypothetical protein